jgi:molybdenum cofactor cytidylyltransferase
MTDPAAPLSSIGAVVLAAGLSTRMGQPKMVLPWNGMTVIEKVIATIIEAGVKSINVITGGAHSEVERALHQLPVRTIFNPRYANGEMLDSLQLGLQALQADIDAALIVLGDQPLIEKQVVQNVIALYQNERANLIVPSYQMRRGHPWLVERSLWAQILELKPPQTLRDFMRANSDHILYHVVNTSSILQDLDTPEDYAEQKPGSDH